MIRSHSTRLRSLIAAAALLAGSAALVSGQVTISRFTIDCGGSTVALQGQPGVRVTGVMGQPDAGAPLTGAGGITLRTGFLVPTPSCVGDLNSDGVINTTDLTILLGRFGQSGQGITNGDLNGDGTCNTADLTILLGAFGRPC